MEDEVLAVLGILIVLCLILFIGIYICKWIYEFYNWIKEKIRPSREIYEVPIVNIQSIPPIEPRLPSYEEATRQTSDLITRPRRRRRRNHSHNNVASDNVINNERGDTDTQLDGESTGDSNNGGSSNENGNNGTHESEYDRYNVTLSFGENVVRLSSKNEDANESNAADDSGIKSGSGDDTSEKFDNTSISSRYETASGSSAGGGDSRAPSPWINF